MTAAGGGTVLGEVAWALVLPTESERNTGRSASIQLYSAVKNSRPVSPCGQITASANPEFTVVENGAVALPGQGLATEHVAKNGSRSVRRTTLAFSSPKEPSGIVASGPHIEIVFFAPAPAS